MRELDDVYLTIILLSSTVTRCHTHETLKPAAADLALVSFFPTSNKQHERKHEHEPTKGKIKKWHYPCGTFSFGFNPVEVWDIVYHQPSAFKYGIGWRHGIRLLALESLPGLVKR